MDAIVVYGTNLSGSPVNTSSSNMWRYLPLSNGPTYWDYWSNGSGGSGAWLQYLGTTYTQPMLSAMRIYSDSRIYLADIHVEPHTDNANARQNILDAANGQPVRTSCYGTAPCNTIQLLPQLLNGILSLADNFDFSISEIAGGSHTTSNSTHYYGRSIDVNVVDGIPVSLMSESSVNAFRQAAFNAGASVIYDPYHDPYGGHNTHFHIQWNLIEE